MLWYIYYNQRLWIIPFIVWDVSTIRLLYLPHITAFDLCLLINSEQITSGHGWLQKPSTRFIKSCGLAVAHFKNYKVADLKNFEVADLRLRIQESWNVVADLRLRTNLLNVQKRTWGGGWRKFKFGFGVADCGLKKNLRYPALIIRDQHSEQWI